MRIYQWKPCVHKHMATLVSHVCKVISAYTIGLINMVCVCVCASTYLSCPALPYLISSHPIQSNLSESNLPFLSLERIPMYSYYREVLSTEVENPSIPMPWSCSDLSTDLRSPSNPRPRKNVTRNMRFYPLVN